MDSLDVEIVKALIQDCRLSFQELSKRTGITRSAVKKRVDRLVESDVIHMFVIRLSAAMTNMENAFAILEFDSPPNEDNLLRALEISPSITKVSEAFDGRYCVFGVYFSTDELSRLTSLLRSLESLKNVTLFSKFMVNRGGKMKLTAVHMKILRCLMDDARMSIGDIAEKTGLTARRVTKALNQMRENYTVEFTIRLTENVGEKGMEVVTKIGWNTREALLEDVLQWLKDKFSDNYIAADPVATEPTILVEFTVDQVRDLEAISKKLRDSPSITTVESMILYPAHRFPDPRMRKLDEVLTQAGF